MEVIYTEEQLRDKCIEWQKVLRLQDWDIETSIVRQRDMYDEGNLGECEYTEELKHAFIRIVDPIDYQDKTSQDMEWILVHELLHLHFISIWEDDKEKYLEQTINQMAFALIRLQRRV